MSNKMYIAKSTDEAIIERSENGGAVTALLKFALESKLVDGVVTVKAINGNRYGALPVLITDPEELLDRTVNYGLYYICHFLTTGKELAQEILNENIERSSIRVGVPVKLGFHSRPSLLVAKIVQHYGGQVELCVDKDRFDASSVLDIQWAGGKIQKEKISEVVFEGDVRALKDIEILAGVNYGEDTMGKGIPLPKELNYLK